MTEELNISEILKGKSKGTKLYSPIFGDCTFSFIQGVTDAICVIANDTREFFDYKGLYSPTGERQLFPSKEMRDWEKYAWKKGDVLVHKDGTVHIIFEGFEDDMYRTFKGKYYLWEDNGHIEQFDDHLHCMETSVFIKANDDDTQTYINTIEKKLGGKLNRETLEIEKLEFNDGDIVTITFNWGEEIVYIFKSEDSNSYSYYAWLNGSIPTIIESSHPKSDIYTVRLSTEAEKQKLFEALAKEGKAWDSEKKQIINLKPKWTPKPFDRVITRNAADDVWTANIFSHMDSHGEYVTIACVGGYTQCLPYNEETAKLIGTTKDVEG